MNKTERKTIEKLARSAYAKHLLEGLTIHQNYTLPEVIRYWATAKEDAGVICSQLVGYDHNVFQLLEDHDANVDRLEAEIAAQVKVAVVEDWQDADNRKTISIAKLPAKFELRAFPGITLQVASFYSYFNDHGQLQLVLERLDTRDHFGKGTLPEIQAQIAKAVR